MYLLHHIILTLYIALFIIIVTFPHPDCIWIYGNKDDDDAYAQNNFILCIKKFNFKHTYQYYVVINY
jgi:hypothetical protein